VVDTCRVMQYPMRTLMLALECFIARLDLLDRFEVDYARYSGALEHRLSEIICHIGTTDEYNAPEWCVPYDKESRADGVQTELVSVSTSLLQYTLVYALTLHWYAERYTAAQTVTVPREGIVTHSHVNITTRVPMHVVAQSEWVPSIRSVNRALDFFCRYTHNLVDDTYATALRQFLLEFEPRPCDVDLYRLLRHNNTAFAQSALEYEFVKSNTVARTFTNRVYYDRPPYSYIEDYMQWVYGNRQTTRSAAMERQGMVRELALLYGVDQFITSKFRIRWRERFMLFQRDPGFLTALERTRTFAYPIIVQQFARFSVIVPHRNAPAHDTRRVLYWRASVRARQAGRQLTTPAPPLLAPDVPYIQHSRTYDAPTFLDAFAIWSLWFVVLNNAALDSTTNMTDFLVELFGWD
jgi:hypothetical protein